ncbi:jhy protein homolog isoform X2 [Cyclopterus lumpus]|uniref:jhy protein homolog isoform X2 n=1 Tax=Cyclopterus lumpus TaxID=8103 RepID=UPI001485FDFA|nr:jhy protein homolog isoform X2 [Cyclopterus lumpus]XP_034406346.1 jhy protein homolog isoform X2 [Cyclopterus lumpus]
MSLVLKTEQVRRPSLRQPVLASQWDSVESDTESMAHERAHQQQQQMHTGHHEQKKCTLPQNENADRLQQVDDNACNDDEAEHHQVYDSLDAKRTPTLLQTEYLDTQMDEREGTSQLPSGDAYSDLRYDPNWRTNLRGAGRFNKNPHVSVEDYYQVPKEKPGQSRGDSQGPVIKGGYRYIVNTSPAVAVTADTAGNEPDQPYHLHPQDDQTGAVTSPHSHNHALQPQSPEEDHSKPSCSVTKNDGDKSLPMGFREKCVRSCDIQNLKTLFLQELGGTHGGPTQIQQMSTFPIVLFNKMSEDIVERNKTTLGRKTSQCGSYASVYGRKQEMPHNSNKVHATPKETESQKDSSDPELKTQQLRISERKKAQRKEYHHPPRPRQQPPALEVKAEWGDCLSSTLAGPAAVTQPNPQKTTPSEPLRATIHVNINLNTSSHLLPLIQQRGQDEIINLASLHGCPHWRPASEDELALSPGCQQTNPGVSSQMSWKGVNAHLHHRGLEGYLEQRQRATALKWPIVCEGDDQDCPHEVHGKEFPQSLPRTPTTTLSLGSGSYPVLPAIEKSMTGKEPELSPGVNRSSSNGYLVQMENQKQLRARVTYKAYSLKSYKQLKSDMNLRGLGPDYTAIEETKLYSNVIREQNKKISRIPFLLAKDPEGSDKKVPRVKALEYAKTIAKPPVQSQPQQRQKHWAKGFTEHASYLDVSQLATLDVLRKRHEEEKQAVALFRKVPAV